MLRFNDVVVSSNLIFFKCQHWRKIEKKMTLTDIFNLGNLIISVEKIENSISRSEKKIFKELKKPNSRN